MLGENALVELDADAVTVATVEVLAAKGSLVTLSALVAGTWSVAELTASETPLVPTWLPSGPHAVMLIKHPTTLHHFLMATKLSGPKANCELISMAPTAGARFTSVTTRTTPVEQRVSLPGTHTSLHANLS